MDRAEIVAYTASKSLVFGGQRRKFQNVEKYWNFHYDWDKNITLECSRFCPNNGVHLGLPIP